MQHPNLHFTRADAAAYRERLKTDADAKARYDAFVAGTENCLAEEFVTLETCDATNFGQVNGQVNRMVNVLGTRYIVENDRRCFEKLKAAFSHFSRYPRWYSEKEYGNRKPLPWHSDLFSTAAALAMGKLFDLIYDDLTPEERDTFAADLYRVGIEPAFTDWLFHETRMHAVDSMGHNWWAVCICEPAMAMIAVADHLPKDLVTRVFGEVEEALVSFLTFGGNPMFNKIRTYDANGNFYESMGYGDYASGTLLRFLSCYERAFGRCERIRKALPENLVNAAVSFTYPTVNEKGKPDYLALNIGDCDVNSKLLGIARGALAAGLDTSALRALASSHAPEVWDEIAGIRSDKLQGDFNTIPKNVFFSSGFAILRDTWEPNGTLLAVKSGYAWNHSHNDSGEFVIFHKGKPFFTDSTNCNYANDIYRDYYCQDLAHSVLRIGGQGRLHDNVHFATRVPGSLPLHYEGEDYVYVLADCAGPMLHLCTRMYRNFIWINNRILVIVDDVFCNEENTVDFNIHFDADYKREGGTAVAFDNGQNRARLCVRVPEAMEIYPQIGHPPHDPDKDMLYLTLTTPEKKLRHCLIHTLELDPDLHGTVFETLGSEEEKAHGVRVCDGDFEHEIWFNVTADGRFMHDNSINRIAGFETDAYMLIIRREKQSGKTRLYAVGCSFLRRDGKVLHGSFSKENFDLTV